MNAGFTAADRAFMSRALELARLGLYTTDPNPRVGCVLVRDGVTVGEGYHRIAGQPHAERIALAQAGEAARGATAYVTLEPCAHFGRTPPCANALVEAGVARVVAAMRDPNPLVAGKGLQLLRDAAITVQDGLYADQAAAINPGFARRMEVGLPYVRLKLAASLDGRTAMASGESQWITGEDARRDVQRLRARSSAILTGSGTVLADDPSMNVRLAAAELPGVRTDTEVRQPLRVVLDSRLRMPPGARMLKLPGATLVFGADTADGGRAAALRAAGAEVLAVTAGVQGLALEPVLRELAARQVNEVLLECGPTLAGAAVQAGVVDEIVLYLAPHLMGAGARGLFELPGLEAMRDRIRVDVRDLRRVGEDLRLELALRRG